MADHRVLSNLDLVSPYELGKTVIKYNVTRTVPHIRSITAIPLPYLHFPRLAAPANEIRPLVPAVLLVVR